MVASAETKDYYAILGVSPDASPDEVKRAYRRCAHIYHPDRFRDAPEDLRLEAERRMRGLNEAYEALADPAQRARYDRARGDGSEASDTPPPRPVLEPSLLD